MPAYIDNVSSTGLATTITKGDFSVSTTEHLMAALHVYRSVVASVTLHHYDLSDYRFHFVTQGKRLCNTFLNYYLT